MRRADREIADPAACREILRRGRVGVLSLCRDGEPYAVPLNYGCSPSRAGASGDVVWFHGAREGRKMDFIRANPAASFTVWVDAEYTARPERFQWSYLYASVIAAGRIALADTPELKLEGLAALLGQYGAAAPSAYPPALLERTAVWFLIVESLTGKAHLPNAGG